MNDVYYETEVRVDRLPKKRAKSSQRSYKWIARSAFILLWVLLAGSAFTLAYNYVGDIRAQLQHIQQTNQANADELNKKLTELQNALNANMEQAEALKQQFAAVESELNAVKEEMSLAGDSLSTTAKTKQALNNRINDLSKELEQLRKSIKKLEEAARVY
jgi:septal ring factor EnvC (AmiA/AmiB activator)